MADEDGLEVLLSLNGMSYQAAEGYRVEFKAERTDVTPERPHGISYALVFRSDDGPPLVRFDNAHAVSRLGGRFVKPSKAHDTGIVQRATRGGPMRSYRPLNCSMISGKK